MFENWKRKEEYSMSLLVVDQFLIRLFGVCVCVCVYAFVSTLGGLRKLFTFSNRVSHRELGLLISQGPGLVV